MLGIIQVKVWVDVTRETTPDPEVLLKEVENSFTEIEVKYPECVKFSEFELINLVTGNRVGGGNASET